MEENLKAFPHFGKFGVDSGGGILYSGMDQRPATMILCRCVEAMSTSRCRSYVVEAPPNLLEPPSFGRTNKPGNPSPGPPFTR